MTIIIFLIILAVLIFVHELGHFLFAKLFGIRVDAFKIGFGPKIFAWKRGETEYGLNLIPFGGYVKIFGENPDAESTVGVHSARSFIHKNRWKQAIVLVAGIVFNFIFAVIIVFFVFVLGITVPTAAFPEYSNYFSDTKVIVLDAAPDSPAAKAGFAIGNVIKTVTVNNVSTEISDITTFRNVINQSEGKPISIDYFDKGQTKNTVITPVKGIVENKYAIGVAIDETARVHMPFFTSIVNSVIFTVSTVGKTLYGIAVLVISLFHGTSGLADVSGPVGIYVIIQNAVYLGIGYVLFVVALISISLGAINFVPFPALDGGRILFVLIEGIIRRRIPANFANMVNFIGFSLLMLLMVVITYRDIVKLVK